EAAELTVDESEQPVELVWSRQVSRVHERALRVRGGGGDVGRDHGRATREQPCRGLAADATGSAGHQDAPAIERLIGHARATRKPAIGCKVHGLRGTACRANSRSFALRRVSTTPTL